MRKARRKTPWSTVPRSLHSPSPSPSPPQSSLSSTTASKELSQGKVLEDPGAPKPTRVTERANRIKGLCNKNANPIQVLHDSPTLELTPALELTPTQLAQFKETANSTQGLPAPPTLKLSSSQLAQPRENNNLTQSPSTSSPQESANPPIARLQADLAEVALCRYCGEVLKGCHAISNLARHQKTEACLRARDKSSKRHVCDSCGNTFARSDHLGNHKKKGRCKEGQLCFIHHHTMSASRYS